MWTRSLAALACSLMLSLSIALPADAGSGRTRPRTALETGVRASQCTQYRVEWSGGVARRGPSRVTPRSIRSRWARADANRIRCTGEGDAFTKRRVSETPEIR